MSESSDSEVVVANGAAGLRELVLHNGRAHFSESAPAAIKNVYGWAFDESLLLVVWPTNKTWPFNEYWELVSMRRKGNIWVEAQRVRTDKKITNPAYTSYIPVSIAVCGSRVLFGRFGDYTINVYEVNVNYRILWSIGTLYLNNSFKFFACTRRGNDTLVAFSHDKSVSLQRFDSLALRLEPLANVELSSPAFLLFRGEKLLVWDRNWSTGIHCIVSLRVSGSGLTEKHVLLDNVEVSAWTLTSMHDKLIIWNKNSALMRVYRFA